MNVNEQQQHIVYEILKSASGQNFVVSGGPGTGKSLLAIKLFQALKGMGRKKVLFMMYNNPLAQYSRQQCECDAYHEIKTSSSWLGSKRILGKINNAKTAEEKNGIFEDLASERGEKDAKKTYDTIIIDEAQDFPEGFMELMATYAAQVICFIDPNQAIRENKMSVEQLKSALCTQFDFILDKNYRNAQKIIDFSKLFWNGGEKLFPEKSANAENSIVNIYSIPQNKRRVMQDFEVPVLDISFVKEKIRSIIENAPDKKIGIFVNGGRNNQGVKEAYDKFFSSNDKFNVQCYLSDRYESTDLDFEKNGVYLLSFGTMKGLEFDIVIIPDFDGIRKMSFTEDNPNAYKNTIFTALTRSRNELHLFVNGKRQSKKFIDVSPIYDANNRNLFNWE